MAYSPCLFCLASSLPPAITQATDAGLAMATLPAVVSSEGVQPWVASAMAQREVIRDRRMSINHYVFIFII